MASRRAEASRSARGEPFVHGTCIAWLQAGIWRGLLICGPPGAGKTRLALALAVAATPGTIRLVSDDLVQVTRQGASLVATPPYTALDALGTRLLGLALPRGGLPRRLACQAAVPVAGIVFVGARAGPTPASGQEIGDLRCPMAAAGGDIMRFGQRRYIVALRGRRLRHTSGPKIARAIVRGGGRGCDLSSLRSAGARLRGSARGGKVRRPSSASSVPVGLFRSPALGFDATGTIVGAVMAKGTVIGSGARMERGEGLPMVTVRSGRSSRSSRVGVLKTKGEREPFR